MKKERVKSLGSKAFSNRMYTIKIDFYDHNMADATIDLKPWRSGRWHNHQHFCYIPFDECITESMYDYEECLQMLDLDKVDSISHIVGMPLDLRLASPEEIARATDEHYGDGFGRTAEVRLA